MVGVPTAAVAYQRRTAAGVMSRNSTAANVSRKAAPLDAVSPALSYGSGLAFVSPFSPMCS
jgi:hypothetical protein